jgi:cysteine-S-conjugate beta-lyase
MTYNFDQLIDRHNTDSYKWDANNDTLTVIPMPVADMDFQCPQAIIDTLVAIDQHGIMGYAIRPPELNEVFVSRLAALYNWHIDPEWLVWLPGLVPGITTACKTVGDVGSAILTATPVYGPFHQAPAWVGKQTQTFPLIEQQGRWTIDIPTMEAAITPDTKLFLLCNPHNPGGTVFRKEELEQIVAVCQRHDIVICSDEIHCDLILDPSLQHIPIAPLSDWALQNSITLFAPSKTFNIAGLGCSVAVIPNPTLRRQFESAKMGMMNSLSRQAYQAALVAYRDCEDWRQALVSYLKQNHDLLYQSLNGYKGLKMLPLEATYLAWIDARETGIENITQCLLDNGVRVIDGKVFRGEGFFRVNFACPTALLTEAIERIKRSL